MEASRSLLALVRSAWAGRARARAPRSLRKAAYVLVFGLTLGLQCGDVPEYVVEMRATPEGVTRSVARVDGDPPEAFPRLRATLLRSLYGPAGKDGKYTRSFRGELPGDLGGSGVVHLWQSPLGREVLYRERFKGEIAPSRTALHFDRGMEQMLALTQGWIPGLLGGGPTAQRVDQIVREEVIPDLREFAFYRWLQSSNLIDPEEEESRRLQYLIDRGYWTAADEAAVVGGLLNWPAFMLRGLRERGVEVDTQEPGRLAVLFDLRRLGGSLRAHVAGSVEFETWLEERKPEDRKAREEGLDALAGGEDSQAAQRLASLVGAYLLQNYPEAVDLIPVGGFRLEATVDVSLRVPSEPLQTNGAFESESSTIRWSVPLHIGPGLPALAYAEWTEPDFRFQVRHFGRVLIEGADLAAHNRWYRRLPRERRTVWDGFLQSLDPEDESLRARIEGFRFDDESEGDGPDAKPAIDLLLRRLGRS